MHKFKTFIKEEAEEGEKLKHIEHVEDHPINDGAKGFDHAVGVLTQAHHHIISGSQDASLTMKHDGSPSIVFGHHPETGKFFVASKSAFNKEPKINYNEKDVLRNHGHAPGLVEKLNHALEHLPKIVPKKGVFQGDVLFSGRDKKKEGDKYAFTPNTIKYSADKDSEDGKKIKKAKFGLYTHTEYIGQNAKAMNAHFDPDLSGFTHHDDVYHRQPGHDTSKVKMQDSDHKDFEDHLAAAQKIHDKHKNTMYDAVEPVKDHFKTYINHTVRTGETPSTEGLQKHVEGKYQKEIDKVKTDKSKATKRAEADALTKHIMMHKGHLDNVFKLHHHLTQAKNTLVRVLSQHTGGLDHEVNGHSVKPEGFVVTHEGKATKLNDRNEFNRLNFLKSQNKKPVATPTTAKKSIRYSHKDIEQEEEK
jgi:hypothetical protein